MLDEKEIKELLAEIEKRIFIANRENKLDELLISMGMHDLIEVQSYLGSKNGKIVVLGSTHVDEEHLLLTAGKLGLDKRRFEFCLDYDAIQKYNYRKLQFPDKYRLILVGPMPHSTTGKGESSSFIAEMEKHPEMYPRVVRMTAGSNLKITKSGFKDALERMIKEDFI